MQLSLKKYFSFIHLVFCLAATSLQAQQNHFVFVQTENRSPFNITLNKKVYSSTATGYLIIPKLPSGQYNIVVGFGGNTIPDQHFTIHVVRKDLGFSLKNFDNKGWGLFNLQSFETTMALEARGQNNIAGASQGNSSLKVEGSTESENKSVKVFQPDVNRPVLAEDKSRITNENARNEKRDSGAAAGSVGSFETKAGSTVQIGDNPEPVKVTSIDRPETHVAKPGERQQLPAQKIEDTASQNPVMVDTVVDMAAGVTNRPDRKVVKISELKGSEAIYLTYVDFYSDKNDTVNILIPDAKTAASKTVTEKSNSELNFLDIDLAKKDDKKEPVPSRDNDKSETPAVERSVTTVATEPAVVRNNEKLNVNCAAHASEDDFFKLRKKMAAAPDNDAMLSEAKKVFKSTCFTTEQVKNLAYLFLSDQARYQFFDVAYQHVSDTDKFATLSIMLSDTYYINRFKAMLY